MAALSVLMGGKADSRSVLCAEPTAWRSSTSFSSPESETVSAGLVGDSNRRSDSRIEISLGLILRRLAGLESEFKVLALSSASVIERPDPRMTLCFDRLLFSSISTFCHAPKTRTRRPVFRGSGWHVEFLPRHAFTCRLDNLYLHLSMSRLTTVHCSTSN